MSIVISLIKDSSNEGCKWPFHTSLRAQALKTALASAAELRERKEDGEKHSWMSVSVQYKVAECSEG